MKSTLRSLEGVAHIETLGGPRADPEAAPDLLVEVPHGADRRAHYDALRAQLVGDLPEDLHLFFHANTDIGAWDYGRRVAELVVAQNPTRSALLVRCLVPRTFIDTNRLTEATDDLATGGMTAALPAYVRHPEDRRHLLGLHRAYVDLATQAYGEVCGSGGFALAPHTYGPRTMGIARVDDDIVPALRAAYAPDVWATWPLRRDIDLITYDLDRVSYAPPGMADSLLEAYRALGFDAVDTEAYCLHPSAQGTRHAKRYPRQTLSLEVRRDRLVRRFDLFDELEVDPGAVERVALPLAAAIGEWLSRPAPRGASQAVD